MARAREGDGDGRRRLERTAAAFRDRSILVLSFVTVAGLASVAAGWIVQGSTYVPLLLLQLGGSLVLLVPLALLGLMLEDRVRRAEDQIRETAIQLNTLTAVTRQQLAENNRRREELFKKARHILSQHDLRAILGDASDVGAAAAAGVRVLIPSTSLRLRFSPCEEDIRTQIEESDGTILAILDWRQGEPADVFSMRLIETLRELDRQPSGSAFDPSAILMELLEVLDVALASRTGGRPSDLGHVIEIPNTDWAISEEGLYSLQRPYHVPAQRIVDSHENWPSYMRTQSWADAGAFEEAYRLAKLVLRRAN